MAMICRMSSSRAGSCLGFSSSMVAGQIINRRLTLLLDFSGGLVRIEHVWRQRNIVACVGKEALIGHVVIVNRVMVKAVGKPSTMW